MRITPLLVISILCLGFAVLGYIMPMGAVSLFGISFIYLGLAGVLVYVLLRYVFKLKSRPQILIEIILLVLFNIIGFILYK